MKVIAIIQARMGSSRLPKKVLMEVQGKPLLGWMLDRLSTCAVLDEIIVATTTEPEDDAISNYVINMGVRLYRGSVTDVLDRYYKAAQGTMSDAIVRLTADCPLVDPQIIENMIHDYAVSRVDFLSNSEPLPSTWPDGMDVSIFSYKSLVTAWKNAIKPSEREHVTFYFWNNPNIFSCKRVECPQDWSDYRITVDYPEDLFVIESIIDHFHEKDAKSIQRLSITAIVEYLNNNPQIRKINSKYSRGMGWQPSLLEDRRLGL